VKRSKYIEETIIGILKERQGGMKVSDLTRKYGVSEQSEMDPIGWTAWQQP